MPSLTSSQIFDLAAQLSAMAEAVESKRSTYRRGSPEAGRLASYRIALSNASTQMAGTGIQVTLDEIAPHYEAMLDTLRDLKSELHKEAQLVRIFSIADAVLEITAASFVGDVPGIVKAIGIAQRLLTAKPPESDEE